MGKTPLRVAKTRRERQTDARPEGIRTFAATAFTVDKEHEGRVIATPREGVLARFKPNSSPSAPARKILAILMHRAGVLWASGAWPQNNTLEFTKAQLRTSRHQGTDRLEDVLTEVGGIRLTTPRLMGDGRQGITYTAVSPRFHIASAHEDGASVVIELAPEVVDLVKWEEVYARLDVPILLGLEGKFAVTLYQIGQLVMQMKGHPYEEIPISEVRDRLGLRKGEYEAPKDLRKLLERSAAEVTQLSPAFNLRIEPIKKTVAATRGRAAAIRAFRIYAEEKTVRSSLAANAELQASRVGRAARRQGKVEHVAGVAADTIADRKRLASARFQGVANRVAATTRDAVARADRLEATRTERPAPREAGAVGSGEGGDAAWADLEDAYKARMAAVNTSGT